jgi:repressor LexA
MKELTRRQQAILNFITAYWEKHSASPSYEEIQSHFGFASPNAVTKHIQALIRKGRLRGRENLRKYEHRGIVPLHTRGRDIPLLGVIAAGMPLEAIENVEARIDLSPLGIDNSNDNYFMLHVKGDSMVNAHILDGDIVIIRQQPFVQNNEIAAVLWNEEATLKYIRRAGRNIILQPANDRMEPIVVTPEKTTQLTILGKYIGLIRKD